jgi:hypothetical protein
MPQIFHPAMNTLSRATIFGAVFVLAFAVWLMAAVVRSPYATSADVIKDQPVPFSHKHHVAEAGIDCRYCHTSVESSKFAGIPSTETCMNCHSQLWTASEMLEPLRASFREGRPLAWNRVYDLPDYAYFDHSIHVRKGVACVTCHGEVDQMPLMRREATLHMEWCLECHRDPARFVGPRERVFASAANPVDTSRIPAADWVAAYHVNSKTNCSVWHRSEGVVGWVESASPPNA